MKLNDEWDEFDEDGDADDPASDDDITFNDTSNSNTELGESLRNRIKDTILQRFYQ